MEKGAARTPSTMFTLGASACWSMLAYVVCGGAMVYTVWLVGAIAEMTLVLGVLSSSVPASVLKRLSGILPPA
ncbi:hypothetical protein M405DRAFT_868102 [Rhizopogon salebrosus TDB-379]|nr:hypothetical protein M405DRAFT_868102 [Rhizopogon salebrosus TDB-379]